MSAFGTFTVARLREALKRLEITDFASADGELSICVELTHVERADPWNWDEDEPQHDDFALDEFLSTAISGDRGTAAALAHRVFKDRNLDIVERRLVRH